MNDKHWRSVLYRDYSLGIRPEISVADDYHFAEYGLTYGDLFVSGKNGEVLDVGCGHGDWLLWLKSLGFNNLHGVDLSEGDLARASARGLKVVCQDAVDYLANENSRFDVIHAKDLMEHLDKNECVNFTTAALAALKPGGRLILSTYNAQAPLAATTRYGDFTHEMGFTPTSMKQLLLATGFTDVTVKGVLGGGINASAKIRRALYKIFSITATFAMGLRHGFSKTGAHTCDPDLIAVAVKA